MKHPYFENIWDPEDLIVYKSEPINLFFEKYPLTRELLELGFLNEVRKIHPEIFGEVKARAAALRIDMKELQ